VEALNNNIDYFDTQREIYRQEVANKYGLTLEELNEIAHEGILNDWPLPP
jgi:hypothetical protein